jgi:hypothetical protein
MARSIRRTATITALGVTGAAGVLGLALVGPNVAFADPSPSPSSSSGTSADDRAAKRAQQQGELAEALAKELGIDKAKVAAALEKVQTEREAAAKAERLADLKTRLDAAVTAGKLTRAEADAILKAAENGVLPHGPGRPGKR